MEKLRRIPPSNPQRKRRGQKDQTPASRYGCSPTARTSNRCGRAGSKRCATANRRCRLLHRNSSMLRLRRRREHREQQAKARSAQESATQAAAKEQTANDDLRRCDLLERALDVRSAEKEAAEARIAVDRHLDLRTRLDVALKERVGIGRQPGCSHSSVFDANWHRCASWRMNSLPLGVRSTLVSS